MILADSSIWIDHIRAEHPVMRKLLNRRRIAMHPFVVGELALGSFRSRPKMLAELDQLPFVPTASDSEVRRMIEDHKLHGQGIGWTDAHLLAACLINPATQLWTRDKALRSIGESLSLHVTWK